MDKAHAITFLQLHIDNTQSLRTRVTRAFEECAYELDQGSPGIAFPVLQARILEIARDGSRDCVHECEGATQRDFDYDVWDRVYRNYTDEFAAWRKLDWPAIKAAREARAR